MPNLSLGISGLHGQIGSGLTPRHAAHYAAALGTYIDGGAVVLGNDTRDSTPLLRHTVIAALLAAGCKVLDAGVCPASAVHFLVRHLGADAGLAIGGSHHPAEWNALLPIGPDGACFNTVQAQSLLDIYHGRIYRQQRWDGLGGLVTLPPDWHAAYLDRVTAPFDLDAIARADFTVVADFCNGSGGLLTRALAARLRLNLVAINDNRLGVLPHDPEPRPRAGVQVQALMAPLKAHLGFVTNSDMSRLALVTCTGETLSEEYTFPIIAGHILGRRRDRASQVVTNICSSRSLDHTVARHGGTLEKTKVGQSHVIDRLQERHADLAGEGCGSAALPEVGPWYDGLMSLTAILEGMALNDVSTTDLRAELSPTHVVKRKIPCATSRGYTLVNRLRDAFPEAEQADIDGLRFDWPDGWIHVRVSATEPAVRLIAEWNTREGAVAIATRVRGLIERQGMQH